MRSRDREVSQPWGYPQSLLKPREAGQSSHQSRFCAFPSEEAAPAAGKGRRQPQHHCPAYHIVTCCGQKLGSSGKGPLVDEALRCEACGFYSRGLGAIGPLGGCAGLTSRRQNFLSATGSHSRHWCWGTGFSGLGLTRSPRSQEIPGCLVFPLPWGSKTAPDCPGSGGRGGVRAESAEHSLSPRAAPTLRRQTFQ